MVGILVPILLGLGLLAALFGIRYLQNKENMLMIQNGIDPGLRRPKGKSYINLTWGLLLMGAGIGLFLAYLLDNTVFNFDRPNRDEDANVAIYFALIAIFGGLGLLISHVLEKKAPNEENNV
ncbi:MAG: DUF6249 domain-containing protein [Sphingobacterium thalpophilum]|jgi:hypothetical protein